MKFKYEDFKKLIKAASIFIGNDKDRSCLKFIKIAVEKNKMTILASDAYRLIRITRSTDDLEVPENKETFTVYVEPSALLSGKYKDVILTENEIQYDDGSSVKIEKPEYEYPDMEKLVPNNYKTGYTGRAWVGVNSAYLADISKCLPKGMPIKLYIPDTEYGIIVGVVNIDKDLYEFFICPYNFGE